MLDLPGVPADKKAELLKMIRSTHGKTWHLWDNAKNTPAPMGTPELMWAIDPNQMRSQTKQAIEERKKNPTF